VQIRAPVGDVTLEVTGPDGTCIASYELRTDEQPQEQWTMPEKPRWKEGLNAAYHEEAYSTLWRRRNNFMDGAIHRFKELLNADPSSTKLMLDLARVYLKDAQVRAGYAYRNPGPDAETDAATRRAADLESAIDLLRQILQSNAGNAQARFYLGLALERQGKPLEAVKEYRSAWNCKPPAHPAAIYLCRHLLTDHPAEAAALARRAAETYPQNTRTKHLLMVALLAADKSAEVILVGRALHGRDPSDAVAAALLVDALNRQSKAEEAKVHNIELQRLCGGDPGLAGAIEAELDWLRGNTVLVRDLF